MWKRNVCLFIQQILTFIPLTVDHHNQNETLKRKQKSDVNNDFCADIGLVVVNDWSSSTMCIWCSLDDSYALESSICYSLVFHIHSLAFNYIWISSLVNSICLRFLWHGSKARVNRKLFLPVTLQPMWHSLAIIATKAYLYVVILRLRCNQHLTRT